MHSLKPYFYTSYFWSYITNAHFVCLYSNSMIIAAKIAHIHVPNIHVIAIYIQKNQWNSFISKYYDPYHWYLCNPLSMIRCPISPDSSVINLSIRIKSQQNWNIIQNVIHQTLIYMVNLFIYDDHNSTPIVVLKQILQTDISIMYHLLRQYQSWEYTPISQ